MKTREALRALDAHQHCILAHLASTVTLARSSSSEAQHQIAVSRWVLVRLLHAYQTFKHVEIFDPAIRSGTPAQVTTASEMKARCLAMARTFRSDVQRWSAAGIAATQESCRAAMLAMAEQLQAHIAEERRGVAALLDGAERTRRLAG